MDWEVDWLEVRVEGIGVWRVWRRVERGVRGVQVVVGGGRGGRREDMERGRGGRSEILGGQGRQRGVKGDGVRSWDCSGEEEFEEEENMVVVVVGWVVKVEED